MAKRTPINTGFVDSSFFSLDDLELNVEWGRDYLKSDIPATVMLHRIDRQKTSVNNIYGESRASEKVALPPVELQVQINVADSEGGFVKGTALVRHFAGDMVFTIYEKELEEKQVDIKRGDFISLKNAKGNLAYYEVNDADTMNVGNNRTIGGLTSFYRKIKCVVVDKDVFRG